MVIFPHHLFQHLGAAQTLHPQGLTAGTFGAHHQRTTAVCPRSGVRKRRSCTIMPLPPAVFTPQWRKHCRKKKFGDLRRQAVACGGLCGAGAAAGAQHPAEDGQACLQKEKELLRPGIQELAQTQLKEKLPENEKQLHSLLMTEGDLAAGDLDPIISARPQL